MMFIKSGVDVKGIQPEIMIALMIAQNVYFVAGQTHRFMITSCRDGKHKDTSLHYKGLAVDLRLPEPQKVTWVSDNLRNSLGTQYDVVLESDHIHVEFDPKS